MEEIGGGEWRLDRPAPSACPHSYTLVAVKRGDRVREQRRAHRRHAQRWRTLLARLFGPAMHWGRERPSPPVEGTDRWLSPCPSCPTPRPPSSRTCRPRRSSTTTASTTRPTSTTSTSMLEGTERRRTPRSRTSSSSAEGKLFNNAAQIWNHTFYWNSMAPGGGGAPDGRRRRRDQQGVRLLRHVQGGVHDGGHRPVRLGLGVADARRRQARDHRRPATPTCR